MMTAVALDSCTRTAEPSLGTFTSRSARAPAVRVTDRPVTWVGRCTSVPSMASSRYDPVVQASIGPLSVLLIRTRTCCPGCAGTWRSSVLPLMVRRPP